MWKKVLGFLLGARFFRAVVLMFALYVSTFFIFNTQENPTEFILDFKIHGIILSGLMSILSGGMINQFYDREKDKVIRPFRTYLQALIEQKVFLFGYLLLGGVSLLLSALISFRVFIFYSIFQMMIWAYSHKFSRILIVNNFLFVGLSLYPFFGMVIYFEAYNTTVFLLALSLFLMLLMMELLNDITTKIADSIFKYNTLPTVYGVRTTQFFIYLIGGVALLVNSILGVRLGETRLLAFYFWGSYFFFILFFIILSKVNPARIIFCIRLIKLWISIGIIWIVFDGIL